MGKRTSGFGLNVAISTDDGTLLGSTYLKKTQWRAGITEIGYWMAPDARGHGHATKACRALSSWALGHEQIFRVELTAAPGNVASQRVAEKSGFTYEGTAR